MAIKSPKKYQRGMNDLHYLQIPMWVEYKCGLTHPHDRVYSFLFSIQQNKIAEGVRDPWVKADQTYIGLFCGIQRQHVSKIVGELAAAGWLKKNPIMKDKQIIAVEYQVILPPSLGNESTEEQMSTADNWGVNCGRQGVSTVDDRGVNCGRQGVSTVDDRGVSTVDDSNKLQLKTKTLKPIKTTTTKTSETDSSSSNEGEEEDVVYDEVGNEDAEYQFFLAGFEKVRNPKLMYSYFKAAQEKDNVSVDDLLDRKTIFIEDFQQGMDKQYMSKAEKFFEDGHYLKCNSTKIIEDHFKEIDEYSPLKPKTSGTFSRQKQEELESKRKMERYGEKEELVCPWCGEPQKPIHIKGSNIYSCTHPECGKSASYDAWTTKKPVLAGGALL